ncbi:MAG: hypothetical protein HYX53_16515 [Chloroflexi bacterium]|nr:hypothetical protein [Chloroflexota bacterium]
MARKKATLFCAWCNLELGWDGGSLSFTVCKACLPLLRADFEARRQQANPGSTRAQRIDARGDAPADVMDEGAG